VLRREAAISIVAVLAVAVLLFAGLGTVAGIVLVLALPVALWALRPSEPPPRDPDLIAGSLPRESLVVLLTLIALVGASRLLVDSAGDVAREFGVSEAFIGLSLVAIGTSLPEIVVGVRSAMRGATDLLIGNVFGSNLFNSLGLAGSVALITPDPPLDTTGLGGAIVLMAVFAVAAGALLATGRRLLRWEGALLVVIYCLTLPLFA
jgi:cation:H+ antiporter